jgi:hypothetical protein
LKRWIAAAFLLNFALALVNGFWITGSWPLTAFQHLLLDVAQFVVLPAATALLLFRHAEARAFVGSLAWPRQPGALLGSLAVGVLVGAAGMFLFSTVARLTARAIDLPPQASGLAPLYTMFPAPEVAAFYFAATAALAEEFVFRYLPLAYLAPAAVADRGKWLAYLAVSCVLFGAIHWENGTPGIVEATLWGATLGFMFWAFRNPVTIVVAHFTADLLHFWPGPSP